MVVTSSRKSAVRYKLAFDKYVKDNNIADVRALVAFSGEVTDEESGVEKVAETSPLMNPGLKGRDMRDAFDTDDYNVLIVANKFQTGFSQSLLVAMYVDKKLSGLAAVQTLSRLNRTKPGKDQTFVIDFANGADEIAEAFEPYYTTTMLSAETDPNIVHETMNKLDAAGIYTPQEVEGLAADYLGKKGNNALTKWLIPAQHKVRDRERTAIETGDRIALEELDLFRKDVGTFIRQYDFLSQIFNYEDTALEKLSIYLRHLAPTITKEGLNQDIDLSEVKFDYLSHRKQETASPTLSGGKEIDPTTEGGKGAAHAPEMVPLAEVIEKINDLFNGDHPESSVKAVITHVKDRMAESGALRQQAKSNSLEQFSASPDLQQEFTDAVLGSMESSSDLSTQILNNPDIFQKLLNELVPIIYKELATAT
jgi:type I restriction enzyme R subunit